MTVEGSPTSLLAHFVADFAADSIPEDVQHASRRSLVDHVGVTVAGAADDASQRARAAVADGRERRRNDCGHTAEDIGPVRGIPERVRITCARSRRRLQSARNDRPRQLLGVAGDPRGRRTAASTQPVTGREALATFAVGFEVETRVAHAAGQTHDDAGWHVTGTSGHVGAAAAAARTMGLGAEQLEHAIAAGATQAAGLRVMAGSDLKKHTLGQGRHGRRACGDTRRAATDGEPQGTRG